MTTSGSTECGTPGDFLKWEDTEWMLKGRKGTKEWASGWAKDYVLMIDSAKLTESAFEDGPCWRQSEIMVYQVNFIAIFTMIIIPIIIFITIILVHQFWEIHDHSYCMRHCAKISGGRSPSVVTEVQWKKFVSNIEAIGPNTWNHMHLWQSAVEGDVNGKFNILIACTTFHSLLYQSKELTFLCTNIFRWAFGTLAQEH